jgi:antitoxin MazE
MQVSKWGNSLAVRLPKALVEKLGLKPGDELAVVAATKDRLTVEKDERRQRALDNLASLNWTLPEDYKFNREEANER